MLAIAVELLAGRYVATAYNDRERAEWPPHPARLFSALVATWAEADDATRDAELEALRWLAEQPPPEILASGPNATAFRDVAQVFVPVNDVGIVSAPDSTKIDAVRAELASGADPKERAKLEKTLHRLLEKRAADVEKALAAPARVGKSDVPGALKLFAERRTRQPRTFPSVTPACSTFAFVWPEATMGSENRAALASLLGRLVRIGHSSSFVRVRLTDDSGIEELDRHVIRHVPDEFGGDLVVRWVSPGQVERLSRAFELHQETEPRVLPARFVRYRVGAQPVASSFAHPVFERDFIVLARVGGPRLPITSVVGLSRQLRRALMSMADQPVHEILSGHDEDGGASRSPHLAIVPLPFVSGPEPTGVVLGMALILPRGCDEQSRRAVLRALGNLEQRQADAGAVEVPTIALMLGEAGVLSLRRIAWNDDPRSTLQPRTWARPSRRWASATPVALDRNPGDLSAADPAKRQRAFDEASACVLAAIERIGLPRPIELDVVRSCVLPGSGKPRSYPRFPIEERRPQRVLVHVRLVFEQPVQGPILIGAGRYQGLGLCLPVDAAPHRGEDVE
jgi:CRISPR-associated protein Csb2